MSKFWIFYLVLINLTGAAVTAADKRKAVKGKWRVPEKTLFLLALLGGSPAVYLTMLLVRHKTRKPAFKYGIPGILTVQIIIVLLYCIFKFR
ncbi:MAG: DUF1294 domain-containing protein [Clostridia bacterium]|nr:DUF1294 domain-containing protein [Clostridia bacterium]